MDLNDVGHGRPVGIRAPVGRILPSVKLRVDRHIVAEPLWNSNHRFDLDALDGPVADGTLFAAPNCV